MKFFGRSAADPEIDEELRSHILHRADDLERSGIDRAEAERRARIEFGAPLKVREQCQDVSGRNTLESLAQDVRFGLRILRKSPGFTLVAVGTLALAIGANTVVFAALNAVILRPLDVPRPDSLYSLQRVSESPSGVSYPDYLDLRERNRSFEGLAAYNFMLAGSTRATARRGRGSSPPAGTTSTCSASSRISAASSMPPTSMASTVLRSSCCRTRTGTAAFRRIRAWSAASSG